MSIEKKLHIIADENIPMLAELVGDVATITFLPGRSIQANDLCNADALLVRSITPVNEKLLKDSSLAFVGTCTIGTDHVDLQYLSQQKIAFSSAPGCNAAAVVDYVITAMFAIYNDIDVLRKKVVGIVGYGQVGSRLKLRLDALGISCMICDPFKTAANASLDEILHCDIVSLHVPYVIEGEHKTRHLLGLSQLQCIKRDALLINTSRGAVIDNHALLAILSGHRFYTVLDVYEDEPAPDVTLLEALDIATAHIAGYSLHGKIRGTLQVVEALFAHFSIDHTIPDLLLPLSRHIDVAENAGMSELVRTAYDIRLDSCSFIGSLRKAANKESRAKAFDEYRKYYPVRYEWSFTSVSAGKAVKDLAIVSGFRKS